MRTRTRAVLRGRGRGPRVRASRSRSRGRASPQRFPCRETRPPCNSPRPSSGVVESLAVFGVKESGPLARDVYPAGSHALLRPRVRRPPGMVEAVGARRVNRYLAGQSLAPGSVLEDALCHRTAADIPRADEQDAYHARNFMVRSRAFQVALGALPGRLRGRAGRPGPGRPPARSQPSRVAWSSAFARGRTLDILDATVGHRRDDDRVHCNQYTAKQAASPLHRITLDDITTSSSSSFGNASDVRNTAEASTRRLTQSGNRGPCRSCTLRRGHSRS